MPSGVGSEPQSNESVNVSKSNVGNAFETEEVSVLSLVSFFRYVHPLI